MSLYTILSVSIFYIYIFLGIYVLVLDIRNRLNRTFFFLTLSGGLWNFLACFVFSADNEQKVWLWFRIASTSGIIFTPLILHFAVNLTRALKRRWPVLLIYLPSVIVHYRNWTSFFIFDRIVRTDNIWVFLPAFRSFWMYYWYFYSHGVMVLSLILINRWRKCASSLREKNQADIIFNSQLIYFIIASLNDYFIAPRLGIPAISPILLLIYIFGNWYAITRYRFLSITHKTVSRDILENMDISVILLDPELHVVLMNKKAETSLQKAFDQTNGKDISSLLGDNELLLEGLNKVLEDKVDKFSCLVQIFRGNEQTGLEITFSPVKDSSGEKLGILLIGQEIRGLKHFLKRFHITGREWETIQHILSGTPNKKIAEFLGIAERTVKSHITHIYNKLGVSNKVELLRVLRDLNLLPERTSQKEQTLIKVL